ncbi:putative siderophore-dependent iron transporter [Emericellopsis atlantica]|uniref:Siderophore-dependent iron transporter n=1 Tax=Emericellopsis atlantica TaxID=2614577 RepID=A0A9P7ZM02_9HYPO|nr:putative siderophore-dependent iron transporter [Emericellopsis atlantica]KAG9254470.1 putative siderophore-dependent iron transporter [Emericellopsis atlantica]
MSGDSDIEATPAAVAPATNTEKNAVVVDDLEKTHNDAVPSKDAQLGVQKIEAVTLSWSKGWLIALLINIWLIFLVNGFRGAVLISLTPYVTSDFQAHSLLTVIGIVSSAISAAVYIPMAKLLDVWGRAEGFLLMVVSATLGVVLMAASDNLATFCAAQVFYSIGFSGIIYVVAVMAADLTTLRNRGIAFAFTSSPYMITAFAGSKAAEGYLQDVSWQWGFGSFAIIVPFVCMPLFVMLVLNLRKAERQGRFVREKSTIPLLQRFWQGLKDFDVPGVILFGAGLTIFLLPFTLATSAPKGWEQDYIIAMIVVGFVLLVSFGLYEVYLAPAPFMRGKFLLDRTVIGACLFDAIYQVSYYCWNSYFTSFLQVVSNLSVAEAGYVNSTFQVVSGVLLFIVGYGVRRTGRFKWLFYVTTPLYMLGLGLMIYFRRPNQHIGYIVMCEIFISMGGSVFILLVQLAVLASVDHQHIAAVLAMLYVSGSMGGAIGRTVSGTIWTNTFYKALLRKVPESALPNVVEIYTNLGAQLSYAVGTPERVAIQEAYGYAQARMLAAGLGVSVLMVACIFMIKNIKFSKDTMQTKGVVF